MSGTSSGHEEESRSARQRPDLDQRSAGHPFDAENAGTAWAYGGTSVWDTRLNTRSSAAARSLVMQQAQKMHGNRAVQRAYRSDAGSEATSTQKIGGVDRRVAVQRFPQLPLIAHDLMPQQEEMPKRGGGGGIFGAASSLLGAIPGVAPLMSGIGALAGGGLQSLFGGFGGSAKAGPQGDIDASGPGGGAGMTAPEGPGPNATEQEIARYQMELQKYSRMMEMFSSIINSQHEMKKGLIDNLR